MSCNWSVKKLGDLVKFTSGGTPSKSNEAYWGGDIPWISASSMDSTRYSESDLKVTTEGSKNGTRLVPKDTVLLLVRGGALHNKIPVGITTREVTFNQDVKALVPKTDEITPWYLLFWLISIKKTLLAKVENTGIGAGKLDTKILQELEVPLPPQSELKRLEKFCKALDDKIILNTDTNQTLEQMAQAIFKSWFVDFEPVKAKMNGEQPEGMDAATASLFPEKLVESELGFIPEGWEVSTLSSLIRLTGGGTPKRSEETYWNGDIPWFSVRDVPSGSNVFVVDTDEKITELGLNKSSTKLLPKGTTIITARGTVGKLALVGTDMCMNQSCYGIRGKEVGDFYNYFNLNEAVSTLQRNTHGAVFDTITTKTFDTYSMAFSGVELANKFDEIVAPLLQKIEANVRQNIELATLRDTLLPKLLSGEIKLEEENNLTGALA